MHLTSQVVQDRRDSRHGRLSFEYGLRIRFTLKYGPGKWALLMHIELITYNILDSNLPYCVGVSVGAWDDVE